MNKPIHQYRIAYQGERGAYSEAAAIELWGENIALNPCHTFDEVFELVSKKHVDYGLVPIENSLAGSIHHNYDLLQKYSLHIIAEVKHRVSHQLLALPGVELAQLKNIYSHPQALAQCERSIKQYLPHVTVLPTYDTAGSAKMLVEQNLRDTAAIASRRAGEIYGLHILKEDFEDDPENYTRFLGLACQPIVPASPAKTSIVFSMTNAPGALFRCIAVFSLRNIDLMKIESRPLFGKPWQYLFYIDLGGSINDEVVIHALDNLREFTSYLKILGSYPRSI